VHRFTLHRVAFSGPAEVSNEIVVKLNKAVIAAVALPDVQERFQRDGFLAQPMNPGGFTNFIAAENAKWKTVIEHAGLAANAY
jgi:tripartite-type tricarboxylate transporter receptor subunit TctC